MLLCARCRSVFDSGLSFGVGVKLSLANNLSQCPFCGSMEKLPEGEFHSTVQGLLRVIQESGDARKTAQALLSLAEEAQRTGELTNLKNSELNQWLPTVPANAIGYISIIIAVLQVILALMKSGPSVEIHFDQHFVETYNTYVKQMPVASQKASNSARNSVGKSLKSSKNRSNEKCHCGSGKKYRQCHGRRR